MRSGIFLSGLILGFVALASAPALAQDRYTQFVCHLSGTHEVPAISTPAAEGICAALISDDESSINVIALYSGLQGTALQAHFHIGQSGVNGGIVIHLCGSGGKAACPAAGTLNMTVGAADVVALPAQGIEAGELAEVIRAIRRGLVYMNVHTDVFPGGEVRGQLQ